MTTYYKATRPDGTSFYGDDIPEQTRRACDPPEQEGDSA